jgi:hypothetical protein
MATVLVFAGQKHYPAGGAADLRAVLPTASIPTDGEVAHLFKEAAVAEDWLDDDYWMNALVVAEDGRTRTHRWRAYIRKDNSSFDMEEAAYATVQAAIGERQFILVPITERVSKFGTLFGPRDKPEITF